MRKVTVLLIVVTLAAAAQVESITVENFSFELPGTVKIQEWDGTGAPGSATEDIPGWSSDTTASDSGVESDWPGSTEGTWAGYIMADDPTTWNLTDHAIAAGEVFTLKVDARDNWTDGGLADFTISLYYDVAGVRTSVATETFTDIPSEWLTYSLTFAADDVPASISNKIGIELDNIDTATGGSWLGIDNVRLDVAYVSPVSPEDGEMYIPIDTSLSWTVANSWNVDVSMSGPYVDPNDDPILTQVSSDQSATTYDPTSDLVNNQWYYWRIDAREPNAVPTDPDIIHEGPVWGFKTVGIAPENMTISPAVGQSVEPGGNATFVAGGENVETWTWYKQGDATPLPDNDVDYSIDANELTILSADIDDEGFYYCVGSNTVAPDEPDQSDPAQLLLKRIIGHWKLDYNLDDSVQTTSGYGTAVNAYPGSMVDPNYVAGIDNGAIDILTSAEPYRYIEVSDTNDVYDFYPMGMTVSAWIKTTETGYGAIVSKAAREASQIGWVMEHNGDSVYLTFRGGGSAGVDASLADGEWHLVVGTYDPASGLTSVYGSYVDDYGVNRLASAESGENRNFTFADQPLMIGMETNYARDDFNAYLGQVDDVKIYTYAMGVEEIATDLYLPIAGGEICANPAYDETFDFTHDCQTNLGDLAAFAAAWLSNGLFE